MLHGQFASFTGFFKLITMSALAVLLVACGGGGGGGGGGSTSIPINGGGVKGPLANAVVTVYAFDPANAGFKSTTAVTTATTDGSAQITGLALPSPTTPPYILEFTSVTGTTDLTTGQFPVIATMRTVITQTLLTKGEQIYATPLTTMAVDIAVKNAIDSDTSGTIDASEFEAALAPAAAQVVSTVGFGMASDIDIFDAPPLVDSTTDTTEEQADAAAYRTAVEALTAVVFQMDQQASGDTDTVLAELAADLADGDIDGTVDGVTSEVFTDTTLQVMEQDPATLPIPNSDDGTGTGTPILVGNVEDLLAAETTDTGLIDGTTITTTDLTDGTITTETEPVALSDDTDGDGVLNTADTFPLDPLADTDTDGDGVPDDYYTTTGADTNGDGINDRESPTAVDGTRTDADTDDDDDGWLDGVDQDDYPLDPTRFLDPARDRDGDSALNGVDPCPLDAADACVGIVDVDGDLVAEDGTDNCPTIANASQSNIDGDAFGDACDADIDGDTVLNVEDAFPNDDTETLDTDGDGIGDNTDTDADGDGLSNAAEDAATPDPDGDLIPNRLDIDSDGDGYLDRVDLDPYNAAVTINFAPVASDTTDATDEDTVLNGDLSTSVSDINSDTFTVAMVSDVSNGALVVNANGTYSYTPNADFNGSDSFTFRAAEDATTDLYSSNVGTVVITVNAVNDAPVGVDDTGATTDEDTTLNGLTLATNDTDIEGDTLTVTAVDAASANAGSVVLNGDGTVSYTPAANFTGDDTFTYTVSDGALTDNTATVTVTVAAVNDGPSAVADPITTDEDTAAAAFDPAANDSDIDSVTLTTTAVDATSANGGTVTLNTGMVTYTPALNFNGTDTFDYTVSDGALTATGTVTVTVNPVNDAPTAVDDSANVLPNESVIISVLTNDSDPVEGDSLTVTLLSAVSGTAGGSVSITDGGTTVTYDGTGSADGQTATFDYTVSDGTDTATATVTVNVVANVPPTTGTIPTLIIDEDTSGITADVISAANDAEGDTITLVSVDSSSAKGTIADNGNGTFTYTANANANGADSFGYVITDTFGNNVNGTVNVTINPVNDAPTAIDDTANATTGGSDVVIDVLGNDAADIDGDTVTVTAVSAITGTAGGSVAVSNAGADVTYTPSTSAGTATFTYTVGDGNGGSATATVTVTVVDVVDATGIWGTTSTVTGLQTLGGNGCMTNDPISTVNNFYMTMTQSGSALTAKTVRGDSLAGSIDAMGVFTLSGTTMSTNPFSGDSYDDTITVAGTVTSSTSWTGTVSITSAVTLFGGSNIPACTETSSLMSSRVYRHVAGEDYSGVYGLELAGEDGRNSFALQIEISGSTMALHLPFKNPNETITNTSFDPNTGFFSFDMDGLEDYDDGFGSEEWHDKMSGVLVRAPDDVSGLPTVALTIDGYSGEYDAIGGAGGTGFLTFTDEHEENGYGKRQSSTGFTRSVYYRNGATGNKVQGIFMGMSHPPLIRATATSELYVEVLDGATPLCTGLYPKRYTNAQYQPPADMSVEAFQTQFYSFATCDTSGGTGTQTAFDTMNYTVRIMDTGVDGAIGGGDDTEVAGSSMTVTAAVNPAPFAETVNVHDYSLNGAKPSQTMKQGIKNGVIHLFGFYNVNEAMDFSFTGLSGAERYILEVKEFEDFQVSRFVQNAANGTGTETISMPAGTMSMWDPMVMRMRARKDDVTTGARALANSSKWLMVEPGIHGLFNVELGGVSQAVNDTFQIWLDADMGDGTTAGINNCSVTNNPFWQCTGGSVNYSTNEVQLFMLNSMGLGAPTLYLRFSDSANAVVFSTGMATDVDPTRTHARLVNPELVVRSLKPSGAAPQQTMAILVNTMGGGDVTVPDNMFDKAVFKRDDDTEITIGGVGTGSSAKTSWCENADITYCSTFKAFADQAGAFQKKPVDDVMAQKAGHFLTDRSNSDWGLGGGLLDAATYKSVWIDAADNAATTPVAPKWVFKRAYSAPDASVLVTPTHSEVTVNLTSGNVTAGPGVGDAANPIDITGEPTIVNVGTVFGGLTWTGSVPAGGEWEVRVQYVANGLGGPVGFDVRTDWMTDAHADLTDNGNGTWTWVNNTNIGLGWADTVRIQIRARDGAAYTMLGAQRSGGTDDTVYLLYPDQTPP